jgi:hypothetical protein
MWGEMPIAATCTGKKGRKGKISYFANVAISCRTDPA